VAHSLGLHGRVPPPLRAPTDPPAPPHSVTPLVIVQWLRGAVGAVDAIRTVVVIAKHDTTY
jgi:hypothetical protein